MAYFYIVAPQYLKDGKIFRFLTPIVVVYKNDKIFKFIFDFDELKEFEKEVEKKKTRGLTYDYKKGLGSLSEEEWEELFRQYSFDDLLLQLKFNDKDETTLFNWLNEDTEYRKHKIMENLSSFDINQI